MYTMYTRYYVCMCGWVGVHVCILCMYVCTYVRMYVSMYVYVCMYVHTCLYM